MYVRTFQALIIAACALTLSAKTWGQNHPSASIGDLRVVPSGALEITYGHNFRRPSNGITNLRLNDGQSGAFTPSMAMLAVDASLTAFNARIALQAGQVPETYYLSEPARSGGGSVGDTGPQVWKYIQEAYLGVTLGRVGIHCGVFLSPLGTEGMSTNGENNTAPGSDQPNAANSAISRSQEFYGLPFYHTGCRARVRLGRGFALYGWVINGWNSAGSDNNGTPSGILNLQYASQRFSWSVLAMGGNERPTGAPEGPWLRWLLDAWAQIHLERNVSLIAQVNGGFEPNRYGTSGWITPSFSARWHMHPRWYVAVRGGYFREWIAENETGKANPISWPAQATWTAYGSATVGFRPHPNLLVRLEYRHDHAGGDIFYAGNVAGEGTRERPYIPNTDQQDTLTLAMNGWF